MQIKKIKNISNVIQCLSDNYNLYVLSYNKSFVRLYQIDIESFEYVNYFDLIYKPYFNVMAEVDSDCLYLPALDGRIICIDKFSGDLVVNFDLGMALPYNYLKVVEQKLYATIAVPVNNTLLREKIDTFCFIKCDKKNGKKEIQSQKFSDISSPLYLDNTIYFYSNLNIFKLDDNLEIITKNKINFPSKQIINYDNNIICVSENGAIEIFDINLKVVKNFMTGKIIADVGFFNNCMAVPCFNSVVIIDLVNFSIKCIHNINVLPISKFNSYSWICQNGELLSVSEHGVSIDKIYDKNFNCTSNDKSIIGWNNKEVLKCDY